MHTAPSSLALRCAPLIVLLVGCGGRIEISDTGAPTADGHGSAAGFGGAAGVGSVGGAGVPIGSLDPGTAPLRRLTNRQIENSLSQLLPAALLPLPFDVQGELIEDATLQDYDNQAANQTVDQTVVEHYRSLAIAIGAALRERSDAELGDMWTCTPSGPSDRACMTRFVGAFGERAYRRSLSDEEQADLTDLGMAIAERDASFRLGAATVVEAMLQAPSFLYRLESAAATDERPELWKLDGYAIAARLSFLLANRSPDAFSLDKARADELQTPEQVLAEAERLLQAPEAEQALREYYRQWFLLERLDIAFKNPTLYPTFGPELVEAMREETHRFLDALIWTPGTDFLDVLDSDHSFVNGDLARLYGIPEPASGDFALAMLPDERRGLMGHASVLTANAGSDNTSATRRGLLVRRRLFCTEVMVPDNIPAREEPGPGDAPKTQRQIQEAHVKDPTCKGCHLQFDAIGFGLEKYDAIGALRELDNGLPIDDQGVLVSSRGDQPFRGVAELAALMRQSPEVSACVVKHWMQWASGRPIEDADAETVRFAEQAFLTHGGQFLEMLRAYVASDAFRFVRPSH